MDLCTGLWSIRSFIEGRISEGYQTSEGYEGYEDYEDYEDNCMILCEKQTHQKPRCT